MTHLLVVVVVGVDVVVVLLVSHVLLIAQLAVESGVPFLLNKETEVKENSLCAFAVILGHCTINKIYDLPCSVYNTASTKYNTQISLYFNSQYSVLTFLYCYYYDYMYFILPFNTSFSTSILYFPTIF